MHPTPRPAAARAATAAVLACMLLLVAAGPVRAAENAAASMAATFAKANEEYKQQRYAEARRLYQVIVSKGAISADLFYNMGNACARLGNTGEAVLYYEKARRLDPRDADIRANLKRLAPADNDPKHFVLVRPYFWILDRASLSEWIALFLVCLWAGALAGTVSLLWPAMRAARGCRIAFVCLAGVTAIVLLFAGPKLLLDRTVKICIVMKNAAPIYSGPNSSFSQIISAPEGTKLYRLKFNDPAWVHVRLMDGQKGFIASDSVSPI